MSKRQPELDSLFDEFKAREKEALKEPLIPEDKYLCVRLDGIRHSKGFLKDHLGNKAYHNVIRKSVQSVHRMMHRLFDKSYAENIVCACSFSDEVSFILLNKITNQRYGRRAMKICTTFSGNMSASMTFEANKSQSKRISGILAFDARPIYLNDINDIVSYVRHRYLLASHQAFWKVLHLREYPGWRTDEIMRDYDHARAIVKNNNWTKEAEKTRKNFRIYLPQYKGLREIKRNGKTRTVRNYELNEIHPTEAYCSDRKLGGDIAHLLDGLGVPYHYI